MQRALVGIGDLATQARVAEREKDEVKVEVEEAVLSETEDEVRVEAAEVVLAEMEGEVRVEVAEVVLAETEDEVVANVNPLVSHPRGGMEDILRRPSLRAKQRKMRRKRLCYLPLLS